MADPLVIGERNTRYRVSGYFGIYIYLYIHIIYILDAYIRRDSVWSVARRDGGGKGRVKIDEV